MDLLYALAASVTNFMNAGPGILGLFVYTAVAAVPVTLLHELGHAVTARDRLDTNVDIKVGNAGKVAQLRLGAISASISPLELPFRPAGSATFDATRATARDIFWIAVSGPFASLIGGLFAAILYAAAPAHGVAHDLLWTAVLASVFAVVLNIIPLELRERSGATFKTDGRLALEALKVERELR